MAVTLTLEGLLLRPQATEASYNYIESLIIKRIEDGSVFSSPSVDKTADLIDLLSSCLYRAGSGWLQVVANRLSVKVVIPILTSVTNMTDVTDEVVAALNRLLYSFPVLVRCCGESLLNQIDRIFAISALASPSIFDIASTYLSNGKASQNFIQMCTSKALCSVNLSKDRTATISSLNILSVAMEFIVKDSQIHNSALAAVAVALDEYAEDCNVRRLCRLIEDFDGYRETRESEDNEVSIAPSSENHILPEKELVEAKKAQTTEAHADYQQDDVSPRSSCPSLDF